MANGQLGLSANNRVIAGVCGGLGTYFNVSPLVFRVLFVLSILPGGVPGPLVYAIMWLVLRNRSRI